tara:strand:+ start:2561 stop:2788 length:228 start_codon:yes stop_codon:yes gene_type:complete
MKTIKRSYLVELRGIELRVEVNYYEGDKGDYFEPDAVSSIEIEKITIEDTDIDVTELLCNDYSEIEEDIYYEYYG